MESKGSYWGPYVYNDVIQEIEEVDTDEHYRPKSRIGIINVTLKREAWAIPSWCKIFYVMAPRWEAAHQNFYNWVCHGASFFFLFYSLVHGFAFLFFSFFLFWVVREEGKVCCWSLFHRAEIWRYKRYHLVSFIDASVEMYDDYSVSFYYLLESASAFVPRISCFIIILS